jgi:hypothetical protein
MLPCHQAVPDPLFLVASGLNQSSMVKSVAPIFADEPPSTGIVILSYAWSTVPLNLIDCPNASVGINHAAATAAINKVRPFIFLPGIVLISTSFDPNSFR